MITREGIFAGGAFHAGGGGGYGGFSPSLQKLEGFRRGGGGGSS